MLLWRHEINERKTSCKTHCAVKHLLNNLSHNVKILFPNIASKVARETIILLHGSFMNSRQKLPIKNSSFRALHYMNSLTGEVRRKKSTLTFSLINPEPHDAIAQTLKRHSYYQRYKESCKTNSFTAFHLNSAPLHRLIFLQDRSSSRYFPDRLRLLYKLASHPVFGRLLWNFLAPEKKPCNKTRQNKGFIPSWANVKKRCAPTTPVRIISLFLSAMANGQVTSCQSSNETSFPRKVHENGKLLTRLH